MSLAAELAVAATEALEQGINTALRLDPDGSAALGRLTGKVIAIELEGSPLTLYCLPGPGSLTLLTHYAGEPDTILSGRPLALFKLVSGDSRRVLFEGEVKICGDVELGQHFKQVLDRLHLDWEEGLSHLTGDVVAHKAAHLLQEVVTWWGNARARVEVNGAEYLQQEIGVLPTRTEVEQFYQDVESLRDDVARLSARFELLKTKLS